MKYCFRPLYKIVNSLAGWLVMHPKLKISTFVILPIAVLVMDSFTPEKLSSEFLFHNYSMFQSPFVVAHSDNHIPIIIYKPSNRSRFSSLARSPSSKSYFKAVPNGILIMPLTPIPRIDLIVATGFLACRL